MNLEYWLLLLLILARLLEDVVHGRVVLLDSHGLREGHVGLCRLTVEAGVERLVRALTRLLLLGCLITWLVAWLALALAAELIVLELRGALE